MRKVSYNTVMGASVRLRRKKKQVKSAVVAQRLDLSEGAYSRLESGRTAFSPPQLVQLARILGCTPGDLFAAADRMARKMEASGHFKVLLRSHPRDKKTAAELGMVLVGASIIIGAAVALLGDAAGFGEHEEP